jgi:hypothetical protein
MLRSAIILFAISPVVLAQTPPEDGAPQGENNPPAAEAVPQEKWEEVTGSHVRRMELTIPAPVTVISREQFQSSGMASIGDFLQQLPEQGGATNTKAMARPRSASATSARSAPWCSSTASAGSTAAAAPAARWT